MYPQDPQAPPPWSQTGQPPRPVPPPGPAPYPPGQPFGAEGYPPGPPAPQPRRRVSTRLAVGLSLGIVALLLLCGGIGVAGSLYFLRDTDQDTDEAGPNRGAIPGVVDHRRQSPALLTRNHRPGRVEYSLQPPVGGDHAPRWQNCEGDVYRTEIPAEHAVHSLEHGAVWVTYRPDLAREDVDRLEARVKGRGYVLISPYPGLDEPISLQAWGYQLKIESAEDDRIDAFVTEYRKTASLEPGATCGSGSTTLGTTPDPIN